MFAYRLAKDLGLLVSDVLDRMNTAEFAGWVAFYKFEQSEMEKSMNKAKSKSRR